MVVFDKTVKGLYPLTILAIVSGRIFFLSLEFLNWYDFYFNAFFIPEILFSFVEIVFHQYKSFVEDKSCTALVVLILYLAHQCKVYEYRHKCKHTGIVNHHLHLICAEIPVHKMPKAALLKSQEAGIPCS